MRLPKLVMVTFPDWLIPSVLIVIVPPVPEFGIDSSLLVIKLVLVKNIANLIKSGTIDYDIALQ